LGLVGGSRAHTRQFWVPVMFWLSEGKDLVCGSCGFQHLVFTC
jgi:hypothetical protein